MRVSFILALFTGTLLAEVHFRHLQLNVTDPAAAVAFYTSHFECDSPSPGVLNVAGGQLLFRRVNSPPPSAIESAIWHIGWGAEDMKREYAAQLAKGTEFATPLTDISDLTRSPGFFYAYVRGPAGALIELNTASHHRFGHLHLLSADPVAAGLWWARHFGIPWPPPGRTPSREPRFYKGFQVAPSVSFQLDTVNVIIFPVEYLQGPKSLVSTRGRAIDHLGLRVDRLDVRLRQLRAAGVRILSRPRRLPGSQTRAAMIEGPDRLAIQLVEDPPL